MERTPETYRRGEMSFTEFQERVEDYSSTCFDGEVKLKNIRFEEGDQVSYQSDAPIVSALFGDVQIADVRGEWTKHALGQINERIDGPPMRWLVDERHCDADLRRKVLTDVQEERDGDAQYLMRHRGELVRAVMSDEYSPYNHSTFIEQVKGALDASGWKVSVFNPTIGDRMSAYLLNRNITFGRDPRGNGHGGLHPCVKIGNSEIGTAKITTAGGVFTGVCMNGLVYGWREESALNLIHRHLSLNTVMSAVNDSLAAAFRLSEEGTKLFLASVNVLLEPDKLTTLGEHWAEKYGLTVDSRDEWMKMVKVEATRNGRERVPALFDLVNAATWTAGERPTQQREVMERMAGDLLSGEIHSRFIR